MIRLFGVAPIYFLFCIVFSLTKSYAQGPEWLVKSAQERTTEEMDSLKTFLNLDEHQIAEVEEITEDKFKAVDDLMRAEVEYATERREKLLDIWETWDNKMQEILNKKQLQTYSENKSTFKRKLNNAPGNAVLFEEGQHINKEQNNTEVIDKDTTNTL